MVTRSEDEELAALLEEALIILRTADARGASDEDMEQYQRDVFTASDALDSLHAARDGTGGQDWPVIKDAGSTRSTDRT